jgi:hypothetical protein
VWGTDRTGVASAAPTGNQFLQWDNAGSTPIEDVTSQIIAFRELTGYAPNTMVIGAYVLQALRNHPEILDRIKYTERGIVTEDLIASLLGVEKILVSYATRRPPPLSSRTRPRPRRTRPTPSSVAARALCSAYTPKARR